ncbi:FimB/Mfa2 family fimbrial subunit [uncultured Parabacteroides sp.]|mgnify:CR=1 FL=1|uniref:FimB/Mfa2 family fimbrial subunit n=1 Tax=uncultured Parabacteroides sp. TaxID=512312 RepID=UPI00262B33F2|nr:FimB/Mfa2 family fimbrial subunit [uncultured Parabacteroides sp.]
MKYFMMGAVFTMLMTACSSEDEVTPDVEGYDGNVVFEISAVNKLSDGKDTKGAVYSQEATQNVTDVKVYAFVSTDATNYYWAKTFTISDWTVGTSFKRYAVADADKLPAGDYKFLAVGRDASDMFTLPAMSGSVKFENVIASVTASGNESEIFSGFAAAQISDKGGARVSIEMIRKVAGVLGYFKNVPQTLDGQAVKYLRLTVNNVNQQVNLTSGSGINTAVTPFRIIDLDLTTQPVVGGVYSGNDLSGAGVVKVPNSQLGGLFLIPVSGVTLTLGLYTADGTVIKEWVVKDSSGNLTTFDIQANHFYSLGMKAKANTTTGEPGDPGDDDAPVDLLTDQNIVITISPAWELIHNLVIQ